MDDPDVECQIECQQMTRESLPMFRKWTTLDGWRTMLARAERPELEQAVLRVLLVGLVYVYVLWTVHRDGEFDRADVEFVTAGAGFVTLGVLLLLRVLASGGRSTLRRGIGVLADNAATTYCLIQMDEGGAFVLGVYLFVAFGNGFRFGRTWLHASQVMAILGFMLVLWKSEFWSHHIMVGMGFMVAILVLPLYVGMLTHRITEAKQRADEAKQRADEANAAKGRFLANVSHEMRTPLNGVIAMADVLRETNLNDAQSEIVETMTTSAHLLLAQIEDVLDMAKIEAGRVTIETRPFDLGKLATGTVKLMLPQARYKGLAINTEIDTSAARWFDGDPHHIRQVLLNLLANAVKFTEKGEITLRVRATLDVDGVDSAAPRREARTAPGVAVVHIEVQDTGIGIAESKQAAIFEPFTQADDSVTRVYGGTGLGTTIARQLVMLMRGRIGLTSTVGKGSLFWFDLPLALAEPQGIDLTVELDAAKTSPAFRAATAGPGAKVHKIRGARILVAEDNPTNQRVAQLILESGGHVVTIVDNGEAALDALERGGYDLALFDLSMPVVSGLEALKLYRFTTPRPIPVLILSANVTTDAIVECERAGASEFIAKPLRASLLLDAIERHLATDADRQLPPPERADDRPSFTVVETPPLDTNVLQDLVKLSRDPTFVDRLLRGFRGDTERLVREIGDALGARRYDAARDAAHALRGGAASVGAMQLMQIATRIDKAAHETLRLKSAQWTEELTDCANRALLALDDYLEARRVAQSGGATE
jgi:two-component system sensor histidine kinase RpfC